MSDHVFICYAREDEQFALALARKLKERRVSVWFDKLNLRPGEDWDRAIDKALNECATFLIVLSPSAVESREVRGELRTALDENKPIVPVICRSCQIPRQLRTIHYIDFTVSGLDDEAHFTQLIEVLGEEPSLIPLSSPPEDPSLPPVQAPQATSQEKTLDPIFRNNSGMNFVLIPAGEFSMGSEDGEADEKPVHLVRITQPFYIGKYQVTQAQWEKVMGNNPSHFLGDANRPVENVSWDDVQVFLQRLKEKDGKLYRLPTEAEWEYAARAGSTGAYCFGDDPQLLRKYAWYKENSGYSTHPVGRLNANRWNLYDVHGNVWEWVQDWYDATYYQKSPTDDPQGPKKGICRVLRGGALFGPQWDARCACRGGGGPNPFRGVLVGFRVAVLPKL